MDAQSPLADEEELLRLVQKGLTQARIARAKGVSKQAVSKRLKALAPELERRGLTVARERSDRKRWVPWTIGTAQKDHYVVRMLRLLGRSFDGPPLSDEESSRLAGFMAKLDDMAAFGRGVVTYLGPTVGIRIVARDPWDRGYIRWPEDVPDTRPMPPDLVLPDEPYTDEHELRIWALTDLPKDERNARIVALREARSNRDQPITVRRAEAG